MGKDIYGLPSTGGDPRSKKIRDIAMRRLAQVKRYEELRFNKLKEEYDFLLFKNKKGMITDSEKTRLEYLESKIN